MTKINLKTNKLNLKKLDSIYSRLLNQQIKNIDPRVLSLQGDQIKTLTSNTPEKSLKSRVADIAKLNANLSLLTTPNEPSPLIVDRLSDSNKSIKLNNMLDNYISYKQNNRQKLSSLTNQDNKLRIKNCLQTLYGFPAGWKDLVLSKDLVYNFNNNIKKFKLDSILENSFYSINSLTGTKIYENTPQNLTLQVFYYTKSDIKSDYLQYLCAYVSKKIKRIPRATVIPFYSYLGDPH